jgi:hypothetical protein
MNGISHDEGIRLCEDILEQLEELDQQDFIAGVELEPYENSNEDDL